MKSGRLDLSGKRFGRLLVQGYSHTNKHKNAIWECLCDCGGKKFLRSAVLINGHTQSCGCIQKDILLKRNLIHGFSGTRIYETWLDMKRRCFDAKRNQFKDWGGRGITVCPEWMTFSPFAKWAMGNGYRDDLTIERKDNDGNYCPENCEFIPKEEQSKNRRNLHLVEYKGKVKMISDWARDFGIKQNTITDRLKRGWAIERALQTPVNH